MSNSEHPLTWESGNLPVSDLFGDTFFSRHDGRAETAHVFLTGNNLPERWHGTDQFDIAELGFGTGLNFLETWHQWIRSRTPGQHLSFTSFERYPLSAEAIMRAVTPWKDLEPLADNLIASWSEPFGQTWKMDEQTKLCVIHGDANDTLANWNSAADAWYLDGFSPAKNSDMWSAELMQQVATHTNHAGTCATYSAAGWIRRNLEDAGFKVAKHPGYGTKRDMTIGIKPG